MNAIENGQLCDQAWDCLRNGAGRLDNLPGLLKQIIETKAWEEREYRPGEFINMKSLRELIETPPLKGWGEDPEKIKRVIHNDAEALAMFRKAMKCQGKRNDFDDNVTEVKHIERGNSRAYTLERLERESPDLFEAVVEGEMSANAAAIKAGFRKPPPSEAEKCVRAFRKAENRLEPLKAIVSELEDFEIEVLKDWLGGQP